MGHSRIKKLRIMTESIYITLCYSHYTMMELNRAVSQQDNPTYEEAEKMASFYNNIFGFDVQPHSLIHDKDKCINESIEDYNRFKTYVEALLILGYDKDDIIAFCKNVDRSYVKGLQLFKMYSPTQYKVYAEALMLFIIGECDINFLINSFTEVDIFKKAVYPISKNGIKSFMCSMKRAYEVFHEIVDKRNFRKQKKS